MNGNILVVDDEKTICDLVAYALRKEGFTVEVSYSGEDCLTKIQTFKPDVLIIDVMMGDLSGFDILKNLDCSWSMGIVMLTAKNNIVDKVLGLELGADDYITKPFDIREVIARTKSLYRRVLKSSQRRMSEINILDLKIIVPQRKVVLLDEELDFTPKEFDLLLTLLSNTNKVYTRDDLLDIVWDIDYFGCTRTVDVHIQRIRKKLPDFYSDIIQTVHKIGYKGVCDL